MKEKEKDELLKFIKEDDAAFFLEMMDHLNDEELERFMKENPDILNNMF